MKWILSHAAYQEMRLAEKGYDHDARRASQLQAMLPDSFMGDRIEASSQFPYDAPCTACSGSGAGEQSTWCLTCKGVGGATIDGMGFDLQRGKTLLIAKPWPGKRFAIAFPLTVSVPAAPMRGRIKEVHLP